MLSNHSTLKLGIILALVVAIIIDVTVRLSPDSSSSLVPLSEKVFNKNSSNSQKNDLFKDDDFKKYKKMAAAIVAEQMAEYKQLAPVRNTFTGNFACLDSSKSPLTQAVRQDDKILLANRSYKKYPDYCFEEIKRHDSYTQLAQMALDRQQYHTVKYIHEEPIYKITIEPITTLSNGERTDIITIEATKYDFKATIKFVYHSPPS